ncbi:MAG: bifunctional metallophosphatase/5'-nucleotidase [Mogibacterium sp.]|nr:bifunctional metallophosphatase/5'-nucleotidase [Mogibacterium sp.]
MKDPVKKITLLHSNDIHGNFTGSLNDDGTVSESLAQLSGYIKAAKEANPDTIYCNAGDAFRGSLIDSEFLGLSTMNILNLLDIDVMALGNHELDYGISHMMLVDRFAEFPIINANLLIRENENRLFKPYHMVHCSCGLKILFIGLLTKDILDLAKNEGIVGTFIKVQDSIKEIERCRNTLREKGQTADLTVLLTHIGYEADLELAKQLDPSLGVDIIVGGHSHTYIEEPAVENGILIVQAGMNNTHLGRFDLFYNTQKKQIDSWEWQMIPIDEEHCPTDNFVRAMVNTYLLEINEKYGVIVTGLTRALDNYGRGNATELGQLFADAFATSLDVDIFFLASSSMRCYSLDKTVSLQDLREAYPYDGSIYLIDVSGEMLYRIIHHMLRSEVLDDWKDVFFQTSKDLHIEYYRDEGDLTLTFRGEPVIPDKTYTIGVQEFYYATADIGFGMTQEELNPGGELRIGTPDAFGLLHEYFSNHTGLGGPVDDRYKIHGVVRGIRYE